MFGNKKILIENNNDIELTMMTLENFLSPIINNTKIDLTKK